MTTTATVTLMPPRAGAGRIPEALHRLRATFATGKTRSIEWRLQQLRDMLSPA